jgi:hypothetical protein
MNAGLAIQGTTHLAGGLLVRCGTRDAFFHRMEVVMVVKSNVTDSGLKNSWDTVPR